MPEVAIFEGEPNAFATGAFKNSSLVAVSTGLLQSMTREEVEAVLGHEVAHVANGDMVTLTLIQGVVNTFVVFLARVVGYLVDKAVFKTERGIGPGLLHHRDRLRDRLRHPRLDDRRVVLAPARVPRRRGLGGAAGLAAPDDRGAAPPGRAGARARCRSPSQAFGIAEGRSKFLALFSSHPPIEERIAALESRAAEPRDQTPQLRCGVSHAASADRRHHHPRPRRVQRQPPHDLAERARRSAPRRSRSA